ncbi:MAG: PLP-dependent transferase [Bacteroidia bacterium]|nr:PLP-dependent transferase [Bacteroidia bacterium]
MILRVSPSKPSRYKTIANPMITHKPITTSRFNIPHCITLSAFAKNFKANASSTKPNTTFYYLESPNSWDFALQDIKAIAAFAKTKNITTLIDNSYSSPLYQKPIEMGIDMAMQTATKYIGGHSDTLGGVLCGTHVMIKKIFDSEYLTIGSGIQPFNAWLLIRGLRTLPARLERISQTTKKVIAFMKSHPKVERIIFPFDESFPQYDLAKRQMKDAFGLFTFVLRTRKMKDIVTFCESLQHILMAVSWGGHESLVIPKCAGVRPAEFDAEKEEQRYIRMYVGLEVADYLINDLQQALDRIR